MLSRVKSAVAPLYLFACLILGGSAQGIWQNALLQLAGIAIIAWAALASSGDMPKPAKLLPLLAIAAIAVVALQEVPLPTSFWAHGVRARIVDGYRVLDRSTPPLPVSLTPYESFATLLCIIPPLAVFSAMVSLRAHRPSWMAAALLAGTLAGTILGALQVASAGSNSGWYPYAETNFGLAVGFFANANHMASLLVISLPFVAAIAAAGRENDLHRRAAMALALSGIVLVLIVGIALNGSLAGYVLAVPVAAASAMIVLPRRSVLRRVAVAVAVLSVIAALGALATSGVGGAKIDRDASTSVQSREVILKTTAKAISDYMPYGSGLGSFLKVYRLYESPDSVTQEYVVHAHDDYVELALELGVPGIILMLLFLAWWIAAVISVWRKGAGGPFAQAASIASGAILIHSLVDFPLRTAAISACFAMCLAFLADRRQPAPIELKQLRPTRNLVIE